MHKPLLPTAEASVRFRVNREPTTCRIAGMGSAG